MKKSYITSGHGVLKKPMFDVVSDLFTDSSSNLLLGLSFNLKHIGNEPYYTICLRITDP